MAVSVTEFFNQFAREYDDLISVAIPRYSEVFWAMFYYLPESLTPRRILELGCGTGNLTRLISRRWPDSEITVVDISSKMLETTVEKVPHATPLRTVESPFESLSFEPEQFDLVMTSFAVHHLVDEEKERLIQSIYQWLAPGRFMVMADAVKAANNRLYDADIRFLEQYALTEGAAPEYFTAWKEHRDTLDHYAKASDWIRWFEQAGFRDVDILWRYIYLAVIQGQK